MGTHVSLNLLSVLWEIDEMQGLPRFYRFVETSLINSMIQENGKKQILICIICEGPLLNIYKIKEKSSEICRLRSSKRISPNCTIMVSLKIKGVGWGPPRSPLKNHKHIGFHKYWSGSHAKSQSYRASIQCWAIICVSLAGR